jgi:starvation-inducible DNA-binding protein
MTETQITEATPQATEPGGSTQPHLHQHGAEVQTFQQLRALPIGLEADVRSQMASGLNRILADTRILHDLYKKHHWLMRGHTFYQLHLLMDEHAKQQYELIDKLAERIQTLGAIAVGDPRHVAELTSIPRAPDGAEPVAVMLTRTLDAHEAIITEARELAEKADDAGDTTTEDLLSSAITPVNELQVWFVAEHLVEVPLVEV